MPSIPSVVGPTFEEWQIGACQFRCDICTKVFASSVVFWNHVKTTHALSHKEYRLEHGKGIVLARTISCQLCQAEVLHDFATMKNHFRKSHDDLDLKTYFQENVARREEKEKKKKVSVVQEHGPTPPATPLAESPVSRKSLRSQSKLSDHQTPVNQWKPDPDSPSNNQSGVIHIPPETPPPQAKSPVCNTDEKENKKPSHSLLYPWLNRCTYQCIICRLELNSKANINRHVLKDHDMSMNEYKKQYGGCRTAVEYHECFKCGVQVINDYEDVRKHLDTHQMIMQDYNKFMEKKEKQKARTEAFAAAKRAKIGAHEVKEKVEQDDKDKENLEKGAVEESNNSRNEVTPGKHEYLWLGKCTFQCNICRYLTHAKSNLTSHILRDHSIRFEEYKKVHGDGMLIPSYHQCRQCGLGLLNERGDVRQHLSTAHRSTVLAYHTKYMLQGVAPPPQVVQSEAAAEKGSYDWMNKCTYSCKMCEYTCNRKATFGHHIIKKHGVNTKEYRGQYGEGRITTVLHQCRYCKKDVINDAESLINHVLTHKSTIHAYHQKFMEKKKPAPRKNPIAPKVKKYPWMNMCIYRCNVCTWTTGWKKAFGHHVKRQHDLTEQKYRKLWPGEVRIVTKHLKCQICTKDLINDYEFWKNHLPQHKITIEAYHQRFYADGPRAQTLGAAPKGLPFDNRKDVADFFSDEKNRNELSRFIGDNAAEPAKNGILLRFIWTTCFKDELASSLLWPASRRSSLTHDDTAAYLPDDFVTFFYDLVSSLRDNEASDPSWQLDSQCNVERVRNYVYGLRSNASSRKRKLQKSLDLAPLPKKPVKQEGKSTAAATFNVDCLSGEESSTDDDDADDSSRFLPESSASFDFSNVQKNDQNESPKCRNCHVTASPMWRKVDQDSCLCNACGVYYKQYGTDRPREDVKNHHVVLDRSDVSRPDFGSDDYTANQEQEFIKETSLDIPATDDESDYPPTVIKSESEDAWIVESDDD